MAAEGAPPEMPDVASLTVKLPLPRCAARRIDGHAAVEVHRSAARGRDRAVAIQVVADPDVAGKRLAAATVSGVPAL